MAQIQIKRRTFRNSKFEKEEFTIQSRISSPIGHDSPFLKQRDTVRFAIDFVESFRRRFSDLLSVERKKEEKRCVRGFLTWNSYDGHSETSLSGAGTTGPRTSRGPDSILLLSFSPMFTFPAHSLSLSLSSVRVSLSPCSHAPRTRLSWFLRLSKRSFGALAVFRLCLLAIGPLAGLSALSRRFSTAHRLFIGPTSFFSFQRSHPFPYLPPLFSWLFPRSLFSLRKRISFPIFTTNTQAHSQVRTYIDEFVQAWASLLELCPSNRCCPTRQLATARLP